MAWTRLRAPQSRMAPTEDARIAEIIAASPLRADYSEAVDRESAYERLAAKLAGPAEAPAPADEPPPVEVEPPAPTRPSGAEESAIEKAVKSPAAKQFARSAAAVLGREIARSIFGTSRRRRRR